MAGSSELMGLARPALQLLVTLGGIASTLALTPPLPALPAPNHTTGECNARPGAVPCLRWPMPASATAYAAARVSGIRTRSVAGAAGRRRLGYAFQDRAELLTARDQWMDDKPAALAVSAPAPPPSPQRACDDAADANTHAPRRRPTAHAAATCADVRRDWHLGRQPNYRLQHPVLWGYRLGGLPRGDAELQ